MHCSAVAITIDSFVHAVPSYVSRKTSPLDAPLASAYRYDPPPPWPLGGPVHRGEQELYHVEVGVAPDHQVKLRGMRVELGEVEAVAVEVDPVEHAEADQQLLAVPVRVGYHLDRFVHVGQAVIAAAERAVAAPQGQRRGGHAQSEPHHRDQHAQSQRHLFLPLDTAFRCRTGGRVPG